MNETAARLMAVATLALGVVSLPLAACSHGSSASSATSSAPGPSVRMVPPPGRVEPWSEDIKLGSELSGKLKRVSVEEGDAITRGQVLAELENDDYRALLAEADAEVLAKSAALRKVVRGARSQEREQARQGVREAEAVLEQAHDELERERELLGRGAVAEVALERAQRDYDVAVAQHEQALERHSLLSDRPREEDRTLAEAELAFANAHRDEVRARYEKTWIRSPIDGTVLRKHHRSGESVSNSSTVPDPIVTVGDKTLLRVRVEVDETEIARVHVGQSSYVTADAFPGRKFGARVVRIGQQLGRKNLRTDEPTEHVDTKVLEILLDLDPGMDLPVGLRVDAFMLEAPPPATPPRLSALSR